jgi:hypothetical protein
MELAFDRFCFGYSPMELGTCYFNTNKPSDCVYAMRIIQAITWFGFDTRTFHPSDSFHSIQILQAIICMTTL